MRYGLIEAQGDVNAVVGEGISSVALRYGLIEAMCPATSRIAGRASSVALRYGLIEANYNGWMMPRRGYLP